MHTQQNTTQSNKHRNTHADTDTREQIHLYSGYNCEARRDQRVWNRQKAQPEPRASTSSSYAPIQQRAANSRPGERGARGRGFDGGVVVAASTPKFFSTRNTRMYISFYFIFIFIFIFIFYISPCMNIGNLVHQAVVYFILFYFIQDFKNLA